MLQLLGNCCTCSAHHGILFPFPFRTTLCHFSPNHLRHAVQARLCCKHCRHVISLGPLLLIFDIIIPFALAAVRGCPYHDKLLFRHSLLITLDPAPHLPLVATCSIAWSVRTSVPYINPNTLPKELQLSSLGYFPSLRDELLVIPMPPVVTHAKLHFPSTLITLAPHLGRFASRLASWLHQEPTAEGESVELINLDF